MSFLVFVCLYLSKKILEGLKGLNLLYILSVIERWTLSPFSSTFCILLEWVRKLMIAYVGSPKKEELFRSKHFLKVLLPNVASPFP
jgi:hypothetical protein